MINEEIEFSLYNYEGCKMSETYAKNFSEARRNFKDFYAGKYRIYSSEDGEWKNVNFK